MSYDLNKAKTVEGQSDEDKREAARIVDKWDALDTEAINFKTHWQMCYEQIVPRKEDVIATHLPGDLRNSDLYDTTAIIANEELASALHSMLTNPEQRFFELTFNDPEIDGDESVKEWCQDTGEKMFRVLNSSNFMTEIYEIYIDQGAIGTACLYMGEHDEFTVHFNARFMKEIRIDENSLGLVDVVYRTYQATPKAIIEEFGEENCSVDVLRAAEKPSQDKMEIIHAVEPMNRGELELESTKTKKHKYKSTYVLKNSKFILSKNGYREFPYAVPRWTKHTGEKYGRGPGMAMLPDIWMINAMKLTVIQGAQKTVDPPLMVTDDGVIGNVRLTPGGLTIVRPGEQNMIKPLITDARIDFGEKMLDNVKNTIRQGFYVDQLKMPTNNPQMTAEEVIHRVEEMMRLMGPILGRQHFELLRPLITRVFDIMWRRGMIKEPPPVIKGKQFEARYTSLIARAQRVSEGQNIGRAINLLSPLAKVKPEILDTIKPDKLARYVWTEVFGNRASLLMNDREMEAVKKQKQKMAQDMMQKQQQMHEAEVANKTAPMVSAVQQGQDNGVSQS